MNIENQVSMQPQFPMINYVLSDTYMFELIYQYSISLDEM